MWFRHRQRVDAAFAKGLMFGKAAGKRDERNRIIDLLESRLVMVKQDDGYQITAMRIDVDRKCAEAITEALLWAIKKGYDA